MSRLIRLPSGETREDQRLANGDGKKLVWTIMVSACGVIFLGFMAWMTSLNMKVGSIEAAMGLRAERLSALETVVGTIDGRLNRMETKMDKVLEWQGKTKH